MRVVMAKSTLHLLKKAGTDPHAAANQAVVLLAKKNRQHRRSDCHRSAGEDWSDRNTLRMSVCLVTGAGRRTAAKFRLRLAYSLWLIAYGSLVSPYAI